MKDAEWIADLLLHGLLKASFMPEVPQQELRELTRYRVNLVEERARTVNRLQKTLEDTNIKLGDVATDIMGKSAREMLEAMLAGQTDPMILAELARGRMKVKRAQLQEALEGTLKAHHRFMLTEHLLLIDTLDEAIERVNQEIDARMHEREAAQPTSSGQRQEGSCERGSDEEDRSAVGEQEAQGDVGPMSWEQAVVLLCSIPGISRQAAQGILAEIGIDMSRFATAGHLASWAGMCPGNHESAGKRLSGKTRKGSPWLRRLLVQAAHAAGHTKNTYLSALSGRIKARGGAKKAAVAVGHAILGICYQLLKKRVPYQELGGTYFDERDRQSSEKRLVHRLEKLGYQVSLQPTVQLA
ncbi:MAG: hypothetical protein NVS2B12_34820 [Ktedonobacteraceae bacterium]